MLLSKAEKQIIKKSLLDRATSLKELIKFYGDMHNDFACNQYKEERKVLNKLGHKFKINLDNY